jgi:hypothetical protein
MFRNLLFRSSIYLLLIGLVVPLSCSKKEGCTDPNAENFDASAQKDNGACISQRKKFVGIYDAINQCTSSSNTNLISEVRESNEDLKDIVIYNLGGIFTTPVYAQVNKDQFTIYPQVPYIFNSKLTGTGSITGNSLTIQYQYYKPNGQQEFCVCSMTK